MGNTREMEFSKRNGYSWLGSRECLIETQVTQDQRLELAEAISESVLDIKKLEDDLDEIKKDFKGKIEAHEIIINRSSIILKRGTIETNRKIPCFYDPKNNQRIYFDSDTGEIVKTCNAEDGDSQISIHD